MAIETGKELRIMFVDDSPESEKVVSILRSNGYQPQIFNIKDAPMSSDHPIQLPWLVNAIGEFTGLEEIEEFVKRLRLEAKKG